MVIEWLDKYYFYFAALLLLIATIKVIGTFAFLRSGDDGAAGVFAMLFRWFSASDYHVCDAPWQIKNMRLLNIVSLLFYLTLALFIIITIMIKLFR